LRIDVTSTGRALSSAQHGRIRRRVLLAMSRFARHVLGLRVRLSRSRNPLGGRDVHCRIRARMRRGPMLEADAINGQVEPATGRAAARLVLLVIASLDGDLDPPARGRPA
jgi:hypothetical protein